MAAVETPARPALVQAPASPRLTYQPGRLVLSAEVTCREELDAVLRMLEPFREALPSALEQR